MRKIMGIWLLFILSAAMVCDATGQPSHPIELYYFNPDAPQSNLSRLKRDMDIFLSNVDFPITFQPFARYIDFKSQLKKKPPAFLFVPEWYLKKNGKRLKLRPLLVPIRKGEASYRKVLLGTARADLILSKQSHPTIAVTSMGPDGDAIINRLLLSPMGVGFGEINPIIVPKDSDALFALALGQVDMALVVKENLDLVAKINPNILRSVRPLLESEPIPMPVLCYAEGVASAKAVNELKTLFLNGKAQAMRLIIMEMLQINEWQAVKK